MALRNQFQHARTGDKADQKIAEHGRDIEFTAINHRNDRNEENDNDGCEGKSFVHRAGGLLFGKRVVFLIGRLKTRRGWYQRFI